MPRYALVQDFYELADWQAAADVLAAALEMHPIAARQQARRARGFLAQDLDYEPAARLLHACQERGLGVQLVRDDQLVVFTKPNRVHHLWLRDDALYLLRHEVGPPEPLPWDQIALIAALRVTQQETVLHWSAGDLKAGYEARFPLGLQRDGPVKLRVEPHDEEYKEFVADLVAATPGGQFDCLRLFSRQINFLQALGAEAPDRLTAKNARVKGFCLLLTRIRQHASQALMPAETRVLLGDPVAAEAPLRSLPTLEEFEAYNRWLLQKSRSLR